MDYTNLEKNAEAFVRNTYSAAIEHQYPYHNLTHTVKVVEHAGEIGLHYQLKEEQLFIIRTAGWFHDIGHLSGGFDGHEERSALFMEGYMKPLGVAADIVRSIAGCIRVTRFPSHPASLCEEILCDSDTFHFGTSYFRETDPMVRAEIELRTGKAFPDWHKKSIWLLEHHRFFTKYCQEQLETGKQENIKWLRSLES